jgi:hypothetical protein
MTILYAFLATLSCISTTISDENFASSSKSLSISDGSWGASLEGEVVPYLLPGGILKGGLYGAGVKAVVLLCACLELGAFSLVVERFSQAT